MSKVKKHWRFAVALGFVLVAALIYEVDCWQTEKLKQPLSPEEVVKQYLKAPKWRDRLDYVRSPELTVDAMEKYYTDYPGPVSFVEMKASEERDGWVTVNVVFERGRNAFNAPVTDSGTYVLEHTPIGYQIDWASSIVYNPKTVIAFKNDLATEPVTFRLVAKLDDYFNYECRGANSTHYSVRLTEEKTGESLHGYIPKKSEDGKRLYELLKDGKDAAVMVKLRYVRKAESNSVALIDSYLRSGWVE